jgi:hypothetical protein
MHEQSHPLAGQTVSSSLGEFEIEDWWDHLTGKSWMYANNNPAAMNYAMRAGVARLPVNDEVVYGHVRGMGHLVHVTELGALSSTETDELVVD